MTSGPMDTGEITRREGKETAVLAGGCFWGLEDLVRKQPGVVSTRVGYTGGSNDHPTYRHHPGHAEALEIVFDPQQTSYQKVLEFFFMAHDPTTLNRQGNDVGTSYRSAIFPVTDEQEAIAHTTIAEIEASGRWPGDIVTMIEPSAPFWEAEPVHQDYLLANPNGYTCHFIRPDWVLVDRANRAV
ncbi:MAG: peptide-methionine (S)-S-oxide reductase MsrA [Rhodococcus sp. (in: high G+C Gram-positive bacteria)]|nr:peptide-methionine (S)-S-oxide reductase MsrA [Rhodococcus sp. (in: high G+C Gram-positive bacteria)]